MRFLLFLFLLLALSFVTGRQSRNSKRECFNTTAKEILMKHVDSIHKDWRISPQNYWEAMKRTTTKVISRTHPKSVNISDWRPDREAYTELVECGPHENGCCVVEDYDRVEFRRYRCGSEADCGDITNTSNAFPLQRRKDLHPTQYKSSKSTDNHTIILCSSPWKTKCQFRGHLP